MKKLNIYKILLAVVLTLSLSGIVFYQKFTARSRADESVMSSQGEHTEVYFEDEEDGEAGNAGAAASPSDAQIADVGTGDRIESGELVY